LSRNAPYFPWYYADYNADPRVQAMTDLQDLAYRRLLEVSWDLGGLPNDPKKLAILARFKIDVFENDIWIYPLTDCWEAVGRGKMLVNNRQEKDRQKFLSKQTQGREAADARWKKHRKRFGIKEKSRHADSSNSHSGRNADQMRDRCLPDPNSTEPKPKAPKPSGNSEHVPNSIDLKKHIEASYDASENPYRFLAYWQNADASRGYGLKFETSERFGDFVEGQAHQLGMRESREELGKMARRYVTRFVAEYSKRVGKKKQPRGSQLHPATLTEELVAWIQKDLARDASFQQRQRTGDAKKERSEEALGRWRRRNK